MKWQMTWDAWTVWGFYVSEVAHFNAHYCIGAAHVDGGVDGWEEV